MNANYTNLDGAFIELYSVLAGLLDWSLLDMETEAEDCLEVFDQYEWESNGVNTALFDSLHEKCLSNAMSIAELQAFLPLVSDKGQYHPILHLWRAHKALKEFSPIVQSIQQTNTYFPAH